jgi:flagellar biosynthesis protein FliP
MTRRREGYPGQGKGCGCSTPVFATSSQRRPGECHGFCPHFLKEGSGRAIPAQPVAQHSESVSSISVAIERARGTAARAADCVPPHPPLPPLHKGGKRNRFDLSFSDRAQQEVPIRRLPIDLDNTWRSPAQCDPRPRVALAVALCAAVALLTVAQTGRANDERGVRGVAADARAATDPGASVPRPATGQESVAINKPLSQEAEPSGPLRMPALDRGDAMKTVQTVALFGLISLAPMALLMVTAFVRINIVLILLRQALGSPQVPGNQLLTALALLLTALVMRPLAEKIYHDAIVPYTSEKLDLKQAWAAGTGPIKGFMVDQIKRTNHEDYLQALHEYAVPQSPGQVDLTPVHSRDFPLRVVAPAYLLSELTTALMIGFYVYLPFLVIDLVVASVLAATGLFMLPPALVATPIKLIVFVLADGWLLIATMLLSSFAPAGP